MDVWRVRVRVRVQHVVMVTAILSYDPHVMMVAAILSHHCPVGVSLVHCMKLMIPSSYVSLVHCMKLMMCTV